MLFIFWFFIAVLAVHFVVFPALLFVLSRLVGRPVRQAHITPSVSLIIAAYNEEEIIRRKLSNALALDYLPDRLEILVVCDGSTDRTASIAREFAGIRVLFEPIRRGKAAAINRAVAEARGEILIFSDANCFYKSDALRRLVRNFHDPSVGGVTGRKTIRSEVSRESARGDGTFWRVESAVKSWESLIGSIPTADGEIFALRREIFEKLPETTINDGTFLTLRLVREGWRVVYEPAAVSEEAASRTLAEDFRVKARLVYGGMQTLYRNAGWLLPPRSFFAFQFLVHKTVRHLMPLFLVGLFLTSVYLAHGIYLWALVLQLVLYAAAGIGLLLNRWVRPPSVLYFPLYFCAMNTAALTGIGYFLRSTPLVDIWKKADR